MKLAVVSLLLLTALLLPVTNVYANEDGEMITICHTTTTHNKTLSIPRNQLDKHLSHGDYVGACTTPGVPEFGLIQGAVALLSSGGAFYFLKKNSK